MALLGWTWARVTLESQSLARVRHPAHRQTWEVGLCVEAWRPSRHRRVLPAGEARAGAPLGRRQTLEGEKLNSLSRPSSTALIGRTPASPPGHSEQREPPQPEDAARLGPEQRRPGGPPQVAAVYPVQNGPGGDPVLGRGLSILSSMSGLLGSQCQHSGLAIMGFKTKQFDPSRLGTYWYCTFSF